MSTTAFSYPYQDLVQVDEFRFPHHCSCSKRYENLDHFLSETTPTSNSTGLSQVHWLLDEDVVGVWRNCSCGSTLLVFCGNRRDNSKEGQAKRKRFARALEMLCSQGLSVDEARKLLLDAMERASA